MRSSKQIVQTRRRKTMSLPECAWERKKNLHFLQSSVFFETKQSIQTPGISFNVPRKELISQRLSWTTSWKNWCLKMFNKQQKKITIVPFNKGFKCQKMKRHKLLLHFMHFPTRYAVNISLLLLVCWTVCMSPTWDNFCINSRTANMPLSKPHVVCAKKVPYVSGNRASDEWNCENIGLGKKKALISKPQAC